MREAAGKSAQEAADWAGVSTSTLSKIERGSQAVKIGMYDCSPSSTASAHRMRTP
ncbi:MAG: helix-turn-helix domain-containing protein [Actinomycetota bacterium]|nr:helix-turn-helix domain-containing protein [Actinomycetota bacterium]